MRMFPFRWPRWRVVLVLASVALGGEGVRAQASFELTAHDNRAVTERELEGGYQLLYFGYTHCPDLCPMGLHLAATAVRELGDLGERVRPVFVTVDPKRDTVDKLAGYVSAFHPRMLGLTGDGKQIRRLAKAYDVDYIVAEVNGEYLVHHSTFTYLVAPDGKLVTRFEHNTSSSKMAQIIRDILTP